jgi:hypothetical protein
MTAVRAVRGFSSKFGFSLDWLNVLRGSWLKEGLAESD